MSDSLEDCFWRRMSRLFLFFISSRECPCPTPLLCPLLEVSWTAGVGAVEAVEATEWRRLESSR